MKLPRKMKIALGLDILKEVVNDGIKEMRSRLNFTKQQRAMTRAVLCVIYKYKDLLVDDFLPACVGLRFWRVN